jgi:starch-binding outer membrane protein, SusD/RagB family
MTAILNDLRDLQGLDPLPVPPNTDAAVDLLFSERAFWLFATGHRLGDLRRLIRQYGRAPDEVFPTGTYIKGGDYGEDVNLPIPIEEQNNPNSAGCLDRNP